ncbi:hypothetical protein [Mesorhizobium sp. 1M-11]|uniref:anti-sigma factor family protein n=1 Tax=Mesorhizobium sp. 1M-11 TaxID=1529006 RepID=UPI0006C76C52|nr:hypothetical protein [Mesorhizobium sp. 1M-11]
MTTFSDETVMRYVDGELDEETSALLEAELATDADLNRRLEMFAETRLAAQEALRPMLDEPVPEQLQASVEAMVAKAKGSPAGQSAPIGNTKARLFSPANDWVRVAAAACIAAVLGVAAGLMLGGREPASGLQIAGIENEELATALGSVPSGDEKTLDSGAFKAVSSFRDSQQALCREFELAIANDSRVSSVACVDAGKWKLRFAVNLPGNDQDYAPASSSEALDAYLAGINAGAPLSAAEEKAALDGLR